MSRDRYAKHSLISHLYKNMSDQEILAHRHTCTCRVSLVLRRVCVVGGVQLGLGGGISMDLYCMEAMPMLVEALEGNHLSYFYIHATEGPTPMYTSHLHKCQGRSS
jgi:hypothetical protein